MITLFRTLVKEVPLSSRMPWIWSGYQQETPSKREILVFQTTNQTNNQALTDFSSWEMQCLLGITELRQIDATKTNYTNYGVHTAEY